MTRPGIERNKKEHNIIISRVFVMVPNLRSVMNSSETINTGLCTYSRLRLGRRGTSGGVTGELFKAPRSLFWTSVRSVALQKEQWQTWGL